MSEDKRYIVHLFNKDTFDHSTECGLGVNHKRRPFCQDEPLLPVVIELGYGRDCVTCGKARATRTRKL